MTRLCTYSLTMLLGGAWCLTTAATVLGQGPNPPAPIDPDIVLVQQPAPSGSSLDAPNAADLFGGGGTTPQVAPQAPAPIAPTAPSTAETGPTSSAPESRTPSASDSGVPSSLTQTVGVDTSTRADATPVSAGGPTSVTGAGGQAGAAVNASSAADLLTNSAAGVGVDVQRRNAIVADTRVRGLRPGQYLAVGDGGLFYPARLDLDTPISKFEAGSIRDVVIVKGPYSTVYGPGFSFIDVGTLGSPRYKSYEYHGRTSAGYQSNGERYDLLQSVSVGDVNWGFRGTYNYQQGNDYRSGNGVNIPSSYQSNNFNFVFGFDINPVSSLEFKGLRLQQNGVEFPGLFFDISKLDSEAYSLRYSLYDQELFDKFNFDVWYNSTAASGDTKQGAKQAFVQQVLAQSFNSGNPDALVPFGALAASQANGFRYAFNAGPLVRPVASLVGNDEFGLFADNSNTRFANRSIGYRAATSWGPKDDPYLTVGSDINVLGQGLVESIQFSQLQGPPLDPTIPANPLRTYTQTQRIPESNQVTPGLFLQSDVPLTDRLQLRSGARIDYVRATSNPRLITGNINLFGPALAPGFDATRSLDPIIYSVNPNRTSLGRDFTLLAGFFQMQYKFDDHWTALAAFGHAERAPTLTELYSAGPFIGVLQQGVSRLIGDPNLKQERLNQFDLGLTANYEAFRFGVNGFYGFFDNYITYDANRIGRGLTQVVYTNTDRATLAGVEFYSQADLTAWLTPFGSLSYVQGIDRTARDRRRSLNLASSRRDDLLTGRKAATEALPQIPPLDAKLGLRFHEAVKNPRWQVEVSTRIVHGQNNVATSLGELPTPGFTIVNIRGFWQATDSLLLSAGVENVGDVNYRQHLDPIAGNLLGTGQLFRPGTNFFFNSQFTY